MICKANVQELVRKSRVKGTPEESTEMELEAEARKEVDESKKAKDAEKR